MRRTPREPVTFRQLCAIARTVILEAPTIDNLEWQERVKDRVIGLGFDYPEDPAKVHHAMAAVEHALRKTLGPRLVAVPTKPETAPETPAPPKEGRTSNPDGWDLVVKLMGQLGAATTSVRSSKPRPPARNFGVTEETALNDFWAAAAVPGADRLALLKAIAEIAVVRPKDWDFEAERANADKHSLWADQCFACRQFVAIAWHHIIQLQHGGSNYARNRVALCGTCHATVHPWLVGTPVRGSGWTRVGVLAERIKLRPPKAV